MTSLLESSAGLQRTSGAQAGSAGSPDDTSPQRAAKRQKVTRACDSCKTRKRRCTGELPCSSCWYVEILRELVLLHNADGRLVRGVAISSFPPY